MGPTPRPLTLIVAATSPSLGIGHGGSLPWPQLKTEMSYFARVTKRVPSSDGNSSAPRNAVIMGRRTWESIPPRFRPLRDRLNVVLSRTGTVDGTDAEAVLVRGSLDDALQALEGRDQTARAFVIGGSSIYEEALRLPQTTRVLLTKIYRDYECDAFFPLDLDGEQSQREGWVRRNGEQLREFVGEDVKDGRQSEKDVEFEFCLFEKE